ncbi:MAG TPA: hypothetical protein PKW52_17895 [Nitrospira sp.]|jgi:hypothetical protein|uniref:Uncharacterized protein n=1 Tax=Thauera terpenica 58Eu TaxID=1348657 RepID=T0AWV7_9RHOO|nr:hypothetical protein [Thauera terpenica]MBP6606393.1 hypothetical protein [Nitrospira sp.]MCK6409203.1 hypothetical protein [Thauera sp.]PLX71617.1 MAG: acid shock protein [Azoarcus sp.]TVT58910.1 MAG: hypothetical protein FHK80_04675 [Azoarcus sp. PHD]TXH39798.1 MAG: hypothetical protein E6Q92_08835 [Burkholderiaceae bacterium]
MKSKSLLAVLAAFAMLSFNSIAATAEEESQAKSEQVEKADSTDAKRHSHVKEKVGVRPKAAEAKGDDGMAARAKPKHYHPRDGK